jgi:hypothetical protein
MASEWAWREMRGAAVPDVRARGSLADVCEGLADQPGLSFSAAAGTAGRQAFRRLGSSNGGPAETVAAAQQDAAGDVQEAPPAAGVSRTVGVPQLLAGHVQETAQRCGALPRVLVAQDTTELKFPHSPLTEGLGPTGTDPHSKGLLSHSALALSPAGTPLGVLHLSLWAREQEAYGQRHGRRRRVVAEKESHKWLSGLRAVEAALPATQEVVVIQDREGDVFALLAEPRGPRTHLLLRAAQNRKVQWTLPDGQGATDSLFAVAAAGTIVGSLTVQVPRRRGQDEAQATLEIRVTAVVVQPPRHRKAGDPDTSQAVTLIQAVELHPPAGETRIEWVLVTTLPVPDAPTAVEVVGYYACRWRIERLHYTLKSGLQVEALQHETRETLDRVVALYYVVAWHLLWLTYVAREAPTAPAATVLREVEIRVLQQVTGRPVHTAQEAVEALGILGGYAPYRSALPPGVKVLWRGYRRLQDMLLGYWAHAVPRNCASSNL